MRKTCLFLLLGVVVFATGCPKSKPDAPSALSRRIANYEIAKFDADVSAYDQAVNGNLPQQARRIRDRVVDRLKSNIDANYHEFENQLFTGRARANILFDITELGSAVAINITNGERAKNIISAALTGFKGGRKSIDENFFRERTTQVIISQMQASRARIEATLILNKRSKGIDEYSLDEALGDLINYFYAGTLQKGLQEVAKETAQTAAIEEEKVRNLERGRQGVTTAEADSAVANLRRYNQLRQDALSAVDPARQAEAVKIARAAIEELTGKPAPVDITPTQLFDALGQAMRQVDRDDPPNSVSRISKALRTQQ
ncbi:MAG TPA: hypothetical protein VK421_00810 [Pyrinomonadaceae bacterium]|nr:hypothetical protein [Pyrinomonadaceae bacterium]